MEKRGILLTLFSDIICLYSSMRPKQAASRVSAALVAVGPWGNGMLTAAPASLTSTKDGFALGQSLVMIVEGRNVISGGYYSKEGWNPPLVQEGRTIQRNRYRSTVWERELGKTGSC